MNTQSHRELYPDQYTHPLCGQRVRAPSGEEFTVVRVVPSRFGPLALVPGSDRAFQVSQVQAMTARDPNYCPVCTPRGLGYCRCEIASNN